MDGIGPRGSILSDPHLVSPAITAVCPSSEGDLHRLRPVVSYKRVVKAVSARGCGSLPVRQKAAKNGLFEDRFELPADELRDGTRLRCLEESGDWKALEEWAPNGDTSKNNDCLATAINAYVELMESLCEPPHAKSMDLSWESVRDGRAVRMLSRVLARLRRCQSTEHPPLSLIVRLARRLPDVLEEVAYHPRMILTRYRQTIPLHQMREIDASCVAWLSRQAGRTVVEKAGHRQRVLGVIRRQDGDTPENRVVADLTRRCVSLADAYVHAHRERFSDHERVLTVSRFGHLCRRILVETVLGRVTPLLRIPQPNYVLLKEARYHVLWNGYIQVVRLQDRQRNAWRWRQRTWAEAWQIGIWEQIDRACVRSPARRGHVWIGEKPEAGCFLDMRSPPGVWNTKDGGSIHWIPGTLLSTPQLPDTLRQCAHYDPDAVLAVFDKCEHLKAKVLTWTIAWDGREQDNWHKLARSLAAKWIHNSIEPCVGVLAIGYPGVSAPLKVAEHRIGSSRAEVWHWPFDVIERHCLRSHLSDWLSYDSQT